MSEIRFRAPTPNDPGYLKRLKKALYFRSRGMAIVKGEMPTPEYIDELVEFLADFVVEPEERSQAIEALLDASEEQYREMLSAAVGGAADNAPLSATPNDKR